MCIRDRFTDNHGWYVYADDAVKYDDCCFVASVDDIIVAFVIADRVQETTTTTGTGTITLAGAVTGFQSFAAVGNGNTTFYTIADQSGSNWEVGVGTYTSSGTTLSRDTVLSSSNSGSLVNFSAGTKNVFVTLPASRTTFNAKAYGTTIIFGG